MKEMSDLISRRASLDAIAKIDTSIIPSGWVKGYVDETIKETQRIIKTLPSAEPEERMAKVENKWHWNCDPYDESTSPTEAGYYRIIDEDGTEMTDYFFGEPRMTGRGIGYWATCEKTILAWARLEWE